MIISYLSSEKHDDGLSLQEWIIFVLFHLKKNDDEEENRRDLYKVCCGISVVVNSHLRHSSQLLLLYRSFSSNKSVEPQTSTFADVCLKITYV